MDRTRPILGLAALTMAVLSGCGDSGPGRDAARARMSSTAPATVPSTAPVAPTVTAVPSSARWFYPAGTFDGSDALLDQRVRGAGLSGGILRIVGYDGTVLHEHSIGNVSGATPLAVASSTKWLTTAVFMTFVDAHAIGLDDDIARWLPEFAGSAPPITARQLLDHTSGVRDHPRQDNGTALATCVRTIATSPREFPAGTRFSYGNSPFLVVGRLVEVLGESDFATVARQRLTGPLGMNSTTWPGAPGAANPAFGVRITVDDYGTLLAMLLNGGSVGGVRVLSTSAVAEIAKNQVGAYDTTHDYSVGITRIPRYGLGCWTDVQDAAGNPSVVSGNGGKGLYPWIDFTTRTWGIVGVQDDRGAEVAVPASQIVAVAARTAATP